MNKQALLKRIDRFIAENEEHRKQSAKLEEYGRAQRSKDVILGAKMVRDMIVNAKEGK